MYNNELQLANSISVNNTIQLYIAQRQNKLYRVFPLIKNKLTIKDLLTCALLNSSFYEIVSNDIWKEPNFSKLAKIHNSLYIFNRLLSQLHLLRKVTASRVKKIDLSIIEESLYESVNPRFFQLFIDYCSEGLQSLNLSNANYLNKRSLPSSNWTLPNLFYLNLSYCSNVDDDMLIIISRACRQLNKVKLDGLLKHKGQGLAAMATDCDQLKSVSVQYNTYLEDKAIVALAKFRHIRLLELDLTGCIKLTSVGFNALARFAAHLRYLSLSQTSCDLNQLSQFSCLNHYRRTVQSLNVSKLKYCSHNNLSAWIWHICRSATLSSSLVDLTMDMATAIALVINTTVTDNSLPTVTHLTLIDLPEKTQINYLYKILNLFPHVIHISFIRSNFEATYSLFEAHMNDMDSLNKEYITDDTLHRFNLKQNKVLANIIYGKGDSNLLQW
ncbi:uncharacterized protein BX663DRAFT_511032 [Cokeromyces recurvatus]|uniref:uncharacterized protein n=1 Tax=Cokeromyces recurvatus TaxID=90255 RepID=UPI00221E451D|nr:uncharacterized protein BX663DRAFT_511032 [Cokeromyces recurvatus]KAI7902433.1 hypothetical protein BX663DRAFT_511032 [Cokeromyces recurvatus]